MRRFSGPTVNREPQDIATIIVEGKKFNVYKSLLVQDSKYFERALNGSFVEGDTQTIEMGDDVTSKEFGMYIDTLHRFFFSKNFQFRPQAEFNWDTFKECLTLWKLSDRFLNQRMQSLAQEALKHNAGRYSMRNWEIWYKNPENSDEGLEHLVVNLQDAFKLCQELNIPEQEHFVDGASNMPVQLFTELHDKLDIEFRTPVMKKILKRAQKPGLKRPAPADTQDDKPPAKKKR